MIETEIRGITIRHDHRHQEFWKSVGKNKWEPETFEILEQFVKPGKKFIDIGAWIGPCTLFAARLGATCYAIEPDPVAFNELSMNCHQNRDAGIIYTHNLCIADKTEVVHINSQTREGFGNSETSMITRKNVGSVLTSWGLTLEDFFEDKEINPADVCLIKMDVEAGEILILPQARAFLSKHRPNLYISFHPAWFPKWHENVMDIIDTIFPIYTVTGVSRKGHEYTPEEFAIAMKSPHEHSFILTSKIHQ